MSERVEITGAELQEEIDAVLATLVETGFKPTETVSLALLAIGIAEFRLNGADLEEIHNIVNQIFEGQNLAAEVSH